MMRTLELRLRRFFGRHVTLYRPRYVTGFKWNERWMLPELGFTEPCWSPTYRVGDLRARVFGVRVPVCWAFDHAILAGAVTAPGKRVVA